MNLLVHLDLVLGEQTRVHGRVGSRLVLESLAVACFRSLERTLANRLTNCLSNEKKTNKI